MEECGLQEATLWKFEERQDLAKAFLDTNLAKDEKMAENALKAIVPGAWHSPEHYYELRKLLEHDGYETVSQRNPSCYSGTPNAESAAKDTAFIRNQVLMPLLDAGKTVVLAMHAYGGLPGAAAAKGLSEAERRAAGQPGGILGLIFINALLAHEGQSLLSILPGQVFDPWVIQRVRILLATPLGVNSGLTSHIMKE
ncbi:MAG: hypothetical protein Q9181_005997 [Wetmoreana brouardii]